MTTARGRSSARRAAGGGRPSPAGHTGPARGRIRPTLRALGWTGFAVACIGLLFAPLFFAVGSNW